MVRIDPGTELGPWSVNLIYQKRYWMVTVQNIQIIAFQINQSADCWNLIAICPFFELHVPQTGILLRKFNFPGYLLKSVRKKNIGWCLNWDCINENLPKSLAMIPFLSSILFYVLLFFLIFYLIFIYFWIKK